MPALTTAGRDLRIPDGSKVRILCHRASVQVVLALISLTPKMTWHADSLGKREVNPSSPGVSEEKRDGDEGNDGEMDEAEPYGECESSPLGSARGPPKGPRTPKSAALGGVDLPTPYICAVGALQRMTVKVPDKSNWRTLVLNSILLILSGLQKVTRDDEELLADNVSAS